MLTGDKTRRISKRTLIVHVIKDMYTRCQKNHPSVEQMVVDIDLPSMYGR